MKKLLIFLITLIVVAGGIAAYFSYYSPKPTNTATQTASSTQSQLTKVSDDVMLSPVESYDNNKIWYFNSNGQLFQLNLDGSGLNEYAFPQAIDNFRRAYWPPTGNDLILSVAVGSVNKLEYYNSASKQFKILPDNIQNFDWMPDGQRIVYVWKSGDGKSQQLILANSDTSGFRKITDLFWPDMIVKVSPDGAHALLTRSEVQDPNKVYMADLQTGQVTTLINDGKNIQTQWVDANRFIYVQSDNGSYPVKLYDLNTNQSKDLAVSATLDLLATDKAGKFLYVVAQGANADQIVKIDLSSLQQQTLYQFGSDIKPHNLFLADTTLYFLNNLDGKLYSLSQ